MIADLSSPGSSRNAGPRGRRRRAGRPSCRVLSTRRPRNRPARTVGSPLNGLALTSRYPRLGYRDAWAGPVGESQRRAATRRRHAAAGAHPDDVIVHQQDVQAVVNALWAGGAEAMTIQGLRVISTSAVRCVGNTLLLQGQVFSPPFTIVAIGNPSAMRATLDADPGVSAFRDAVTAWGLGYQVRVENQTYSRRHMLGRSTFSTRPWRGSGCHRCPTRFQDSGPNRPRRPVRALASP